MLSSMENLFLQILLLITVFLCVSCQHDQYGFNCSKPREDKCVSRYDMIASFVALSPDEGLKCIPNDLFYCICVNATITFLYFEMPPYIYRDQNGTVDGIIPAIMEQALTVCCYGCWNIIYRDPVKSLQEIIQLYYNASHFNAMTPMLTEANAVTSFGSPYVKLFPTPGVYYIEINQESELIMGKLVTSLLSNWPLFVIALLLTLHAGVIIWMLDSFRNPEDFPPSVFSGISQGSWWAYVSMTTVGYGDKCPKTEAGRAFSVIWITIGVSICGIFTASLTSAMTSAMLSEKTKLDGKKVGVLDHGILKYELNIVHRDGGIPIEYRNISSIREALKNEDINGILMDQMMLRYYWKDLTKIGSELLVKDDIKNSDTAVGVQFRTSPWATFLREYFTSNKDADKRMQNDAIKSMKHKLPNPDLPKPVTTSPFSSPVIYKKLIYYLGLSAIVTVAIGCLFELMKKLYGSRKAIKNIVDAAKAENGIAQDADEKAEKLESMRRRIEESVLKEIREEFEMLKCEMNNEKRTNEKLMLKETKT